MHDIRIESFDACLGGKRENKKKSQTSGAAEKQENSLYLDTTNYPQI